MSWNIQKPGDYINGPLTVAGTATIGGVMTLTGGSPTVGALSFPIGTIKAVGMTAVTAHDAGNVSTLKFGINDGGADFGGLHVFNIHNGTYSSCEVGIFTGEGGISVPTQRMRVDKKGNIGISVVPSAWATYKGLQVGYASLAGYAGSDTLLGSNVYFDGGAFRYIAAGLASSYRQLGGSHQWSTAVAGVNPGDALALLPQATLDASGNFSPTGNVVMATSGKGIDFSATASGSGTMTSELLNDYEEGAFTPVVRGSSVAGSGTYANQVGFYTKVGRLVTVNVWLNWSAHSGTGFIQFGGLPFVSANTAGNYGGISIGYQSGITSAANTVLYGLTEFGTNIVTVAATPTGGGGYGLVSMDPAGEIAFTATYWV